MKKTTIGLCLLICVGGIRFVHADEGAFFTPQAGQDPMQEYVYELKEVVEPAFTESADSDLVDSAEATEYGASMESMEMEADPQIDIDAEEEFARADAAGRVKQLRQERYDQMPYLDRGFVRKTINRNYVQDKMNFVQGVEKSLNDLVIRAIQVHTPTRAARERISLAKRRIFAAARELFPEIGFEYQDKDGKLTTGFYNHRSYQFTVRQPILRRDSLEYAPAGTRRPAGLRERV